jgi:hypothetical protein
VQPKVGAKYRSQVSDTEFIVIRAPAGDIELTCGGVPVVTPGETARAGPSPSAELDEATPIGKRYVDDSGSLEVLVTKSGFGALAVAGIRMTQKVAKPLPSSD